MLGNDSYGDCVIVAKANHILRFEEIEQDAVLPITTNVCLNQYWKEEGWTPCLIKCLSLPKPDRGLVMLDSLNDWRKNGWNIANNNYKIYAYASAPSEPEIKASIYLLNGVNMGFRVPQSAIDQFNAGQPWDITDPLDKSFVGGHAIYGVGYDNDYIYVITWGKVQKMTWRFFRTYCDESYCIVDNRDEWVSNSPIDVAKLDEILHDITG